MDTLRQPTHDVDTLARQSNTNISPRPRLNRNGPITPELSDFAEAAIRAITVSMVVLAIHLAAIEYVFLAS